MEERTFAQNLVLSSLKKQSKTIMEQLEQAGKQQNGDVSIIYEGNLPTRLMEYLKECQFLRIEPIKTEQTSLIEKRLYRIYPDAGLTDSEVEDALEAGYSCKIGGNCMGEEFAKGLMLNNIKRQMNTVVAELVSLVRSGEGKGAALHEGIILPKVRELLEKQGIQVEEIDTTGTDKVEKKLYSLYPGGKNVPDMLKLLQDGVLEITSGQVTENEIEEVIRRHELGTYLKMRIMPVQKEKIIQGLVQKIGDPKGNISARYEGRIFDEVERYMSEQQGIGIHMLDTKGSIDVGKYVYQTYPEARLSREDFEDAVRGVTQSKKPSKEELSQLISSNGLGAYLKSISIGAQISSVEQELIEASAHGQMGTCHKGILYPETRTAWKSLGIMSNEINYARTNKLGEFSYQVFPDVELERAEIEDAIMRESGEAR